MMLQGRPTRVLLVDGSPAVLWGLGKLIQGEYPRMALIGAVTSADEALVYCHLEPDVTLLGINLRGASSLGFIPDIRERSRGEVLVYTDSRHTEVRRKALAQGAAAVVAKDDSAEAVLLAIERAARSGSHRSTQ